jgi:hypothetical protein
MINDDAIDIAPEDCYSIRRSGDNSQYEYQDLPYATYPSKVGVVYRAGTLVGGSRCPRCSDYIAVTSPRGSASGAPPWVAGLLARVVL